MAIISISKTNVTLERERETNEFSSFIKVISRRVGREKNLSYFLTFSGIHIHSSHSQMNEENAEALYIIIIIIMGAE